jgi:hypothetical protein
MNVYHLVNTEKTIENGPVEIIDFPVKNCGSFHSYVTVYQGNYILMFALANGMIFV